MKEAQKMFENLISDLDKENKSEEKKEEPEKK